MRKGFFDNFSLEMMLRFVHVCTSHSIIIFLSFVLVSIVICLMFVCDGLQCGKSYSSVS